MYMTRPYTRWTKEILEPVVQESISVRQVLFKLGLRETGGSYRNIKARIKQFNIDSSHFLGKGHMKNRRSFKRATPQELLRLYDPSEPKVRAHRLRRALDECDIAHQCVECGIGEIWNDKYLLLQIDHINGYVWDNRIENLRYLCPNCHSQTETYGSKNKNNIWESSPTAEATGRESVQ